MQFTYSRRLEPLLTSIETTLMATLPKAMGRLNVDEPAYALFLWYHDSSSTDVTPQFGLGTHSVLEQCRVQHPDSDESRMACIWMPQQSLSGLSIPSLGIGKSDLQAKCTEAYSLMLAANKSELPLPDESEILMPFRAMMRRCAIRLNDIDWSNDLNVDDCFVVVASDYIGYWFDEDLLSCVPKRKLALLKERGLLVPYRELRIWQRFKPMFAAVGIAVRASANFLLSL